jgi:hypothetical protein
LLASKQTNKQTFVQVWMVNILIPHALRALRRELTTRGLAVSTLDQRESDESDETDETEKTAVRSEKRSRKDMPFVSWRVVRA